MRTSLFRIFVICCVPAMLAACAAPQASSPTASADPSATAVVATRPPPPKGGPLPPERVRTGAPVDRSCKTNADCVVKDVGSCCGTLPACVNVDSPTDPKGAQAECKRKGMMSACGFPALEGCVCKQGQCVGLPPTIQPSIDPAPTPPAQE